jgi:hypothetical protein
MLKVVNDIIINTDQVICCYIEEKSKVVFRMTDNSVIKFVIDESRVPIIDVNKIMENLNDNKIKTILI